jgi:hypothetical protein
MTSPEQQRIIQSVEEARLRRMAGLATPAEWANYISCALSARDAQSRWNEACAWVDPEVLMDRPCFSLGNWEELS